MHANVSERQLEDVIVELAKMNGWLVMHTRAAQKADGSWYTPLTGHAGYPDLTLVRPPRVIFAELKSRRGRVDQEQKNWLDRLSMCSMAVETYLWRPANFEAVKHILSRRFMTEAPQLPVKESGAWQMK